MVSIRLIFLMVVILLGIPSSLYAADLGDRPNILILMADDMGPRLGVLGDSVAITPNIDALAAKGVIYSNTFTTSPVCAPSRASLMTGKNQIGLGAMHMRTSMGGPQSYLAVPQEGVKAFPELLRAAGYFTFTNLKLDYQFSGVQAYSGPFTIWDSELRSQAWGERDKGQPFFGLINLTITHESNLFRGKMNSAMAYATQAVSMLRRLFDDTPIQEENVELPPYYPDTPEIRKDVAQMYNNIHTLDKEVGDVLENLKKDGLLDNTIVIFTGDHGDGLPRMKRELFDSGIKVPMVVYWPEKFRQKYYLGEHTDERLVSFIDFAPTILELAQVSKPDYFEGVSFLSEKRRDYVYAAKDRMDGSLNRLRAIRDHRYKYIKNYIPESSGSEFIAFRENVATMRELRMQYENNQLNDEQALFFKDWPSDQLYDVVNDPHELNNLAQHPSYIETLTQMQGALDAWLATIDDQGMMPEVELIKKMWPDGEQPLTPPPVISASVDQQLLIHSDFGASIGYQINGSDWLVYNEAMSDAVVVKKGDEVKAKAIRYGWEESDVVTRSF